MTLPYPAPRNDKTPTPAGPRPTGGRRTNATVFLGIQPLKEFADHPSAPPRTRPRSKPAQRPGRRRQQLQSKSPGGWPRQRPSKTPATPNASSPRHPQAHPAARTCYAPEEAPAHRARRSPRPPPHAIQEEYKLNDKLIDKLIDKLNDKLNDLLHMLCVWATSGNRSPDVPPGVLFARCPCPCCPRGPISKDFREPRPPLFPHPPIPLNSSASGCLARSMLKF